MAGVTKEQIAKAKEWDLLSYLQAYEPQELKKSGPREYCTRTHDSLKISNGKWCWNSRGIGGRTALDYLIKVHGMDFVGAVETLCGYSAPPPVKQTFTKPTKPQKPFKLPEASRCASAVVGYLQDRGIDPELLGVCMEAGILYESRRYQNCVFVGRDMQGNARAASLRGTRDGFRMDVITQISKVVDENGKLPGEEGSLIADEPVGPEGYSSPFPFCSDGPRVDEFLAEMRREVFEGRDGYMNVGEAPGVTPARNEHITDPANGELDMMFQFNHVGIDQSGSKWDTVPFKVANLRRELAEQQNAVGKVGWASLFFCNHDQPRVVSRWGDDSSEANRVASAKAFALLLHMHRGTPYVYQGEELGMTNAHFTSLDQYRDLEALNAYKQRVEEAKVQSPESMMAALALIGRDNARTPMQWDASKFAGFTDENAAVEPWISVNPNHATVNADCQVDDPDSVYAFYRQLIALRHNNPVVAAGTWHLIDINDDYVYAFVRKLGDAALLTVVNLSGKRVAIPSDSAALTESGVSEPRIVVSTHGATHAVVSLANKELSAWEGIVVEL